MTTDAELAYNERFPEPDDDIDARLREYSQAALEYEQMAIEHIFNLGRAVGCAEVILNDKV